MTATESPRLPRPQGPRFVTDGGLETDLIFHRGADLSDFAAFPLLDSIEGRALLQRYYDDYAEIAWRVGVGLLLEAPTWRASPDWGHRLGYDRTELARINTDAITLLFQLRDRYANHIEPILVGGTVGPRGDGYSAAARLEPEQAAEYHRPQLESFAIARADFATAYTLTHVGEAIGIVSAARSVGLPIAISFTVETDGRLPSGVSIAEAIATVDAAAAPDYYLINCAHPKHIQAGLGQPGPWIDRIVGVRANASLKSHAELDVEPDLDEGDIDALTAAQAALNVELPGLTILGGCCGTDHRHVAAFWSAEADAQ